MRTPDTRALWDAIEARGWPIVRINGLDVGGDEARWVKAFPSLSRRQLQALERRLGRATNRRPGSMAVAELREDVIELADDLGRRGKLESIVLAGSVYSTPVAIGIFANSATEMLLEDALRQLNDQYARAHAADRRDAQRAEEDERRRTQHIMSDEQLAEVEADNERIRQNAERANSVEGRLERVEAVLIEIRDALVRR